MTDSQSARSAVATILARDGLVHLEPDDVDRLVGLYAELQADIAQLRAPQMDGAEPAVVYSAE